MSPGVGSCCCDFPKPHFCYVCCCDSQLSSRVAIPRSLKKKKVHTANKDIAAVPLALLSTPCWSLLHLYIADTHRSDHTKEKYFHFTFWWTIYVAAGCSLKHADLFWFIHSDSGDYFRTQVTGNHVFCSSSGNRTRQSTDCRGTGAMTSCPCCTFSASLLLKEIRNRPFVKGVDFAESNQTIACLCLQKLPMLFMFCWKPKGDSQLRYIKCNFHWNQ